MNTTKFFLILVIFVSLSTNIFANSIKILVKVQDEIVTNVDINNEIKYLLLLNPKLNELNNKRIKEIAKDSLITEIIKRKELEKFYNFNKIENITDLIENKFLERYKVNNKAEFIQILERKGLKYEFVKKKIDIEGLWNQLIYKKYSNNIKINEEFLRQNILNQFANKEDKYEYSLSEIFLTSSSNEDLDETLKKLKNSISEIGFENSALIYSSSNTSKNGGLIGWVNELQISENIKRNIYEVNVNGITKPIKMNGGYLIIKVNDKRAFKEDVDINKQLIELINKEENRQLNAFSIIFYKRLKKNININEL